MTRMISSNKNQTEPKLNRTSQIPLHRQLQQLIREKIETGNWQPGQLIPREHDLMEQFGLSRFTVRQALDELTQAGYLIRTRKRGTIVNDKAKVEQDLGYFYSFARDLALRGLHPSSRVLRLEKIEIEGIVDKETAQLLSLAAYSNELSVYLLCRLRLIENEPLVLENSYLALPQHIRLDQYDWSRQSVYEVLQKDYGLEVDHAKEYLEPVNLTPEKAALLGVSAGSAAMQVERLTYARNGKPFERRISLIRGDRYRFRVDLLSLQHDS